MDAASGSRRGKMHLLRSCESCRASKTKRLPHDMFDEKCQRCARLDKHCVFSEGRARRKKGTPNQTRIIEVEKKIDSIYSLLHAGPNPQSRLVSQPPETLTPHSLTPGESASWESDISFGQDASPNAPYARGSSHFCEEASGITDVIQMGIISYQEAEVLLEAALSEYGGFPWVVFPSQLPLNIFRRERPSLLLSLLALASRKQAILHESLEREFKKVVGARVIMDGGLDLDLLQGLLIYLAWYHLHPKVPTKKYYMLAQIAVAICVDLGIPRLIAGESNNQLKAELERTYIAVYYMSSCNSVVCRKPISMKYDDYVGDCCRSLAETNNAPTDADLIHFIDLQRLAEEIASTFEYDSKNNEGRYLRMDNVDLSIKAFKSRLHDLCRCLPSNSSCLESVTLAHENTNVYLHEVCLHMEHSIAMMSSVPLGREAADLSQRRISLLLSCLEATKSFLDYFLRMPAGLIVRHSTVERGQLAHVITVLIKVAFSSNLGLDNFPLREACNVSYYLDALVRHLGSISANLPNEGHPDSFSAFKAMAERIKSWYENTEFFEQVGSPSDLKDMSPLQFVEIAKEEQSMNFDLSNLDISFLVAGNLFG